MMNVLKRNNNYRRIPILILVLYGAMNLLSSAVDSSTFIETLPLFAILIVYTISKVRSIVTTVPYMFYMLLWLLAVGSSATSNYIDLQSTSITYLLFIFTLFMMVNLQFSHTELKAFNTAYIVIGVLCAILIFLSYKAGISNGFNRYSIGIWKPKNQNYINSIILLSFAIATYRIFIDKNTPLKKLMLFSSCMIMIFGVFLTGTRAAILCMGFIVALQVLFYTLKTKKIGLLISGVLLLLISYLILFYVVPEEITTRFMGEDSFEDETRIYMWGKSLGLFSNNWLIGIGLNATVKHVSDIHNVMLQFLVEQGILSFIIFLIILFKIIKRTKRDAYIFLFPVIIALYFPICFQNGLIAHTFWWPLIILEVYSNSLNKDCKIVL